MNRDARRKYSNKKTGMFGLWSKRTKKFVHGIQAPSPTAVYVIAQKKLGRIDKDVYQARAIEQRHHRMFKGKLRQVDDNVAYPISVSLDWLADNLREKEKIERNIVAAKTTILGSTILWKGDTATVVSISTDNRMLKLETPKGQVDVTFNDVHLELGR